MEKDNQGISNIKTYKESMLGSSDSFRKINIMTSNVHLKKKVVMLTLICCELLEYFGYLFASAVGIENIHSPTSKSQWIIVRQPFITLIFLINHTVVKFIMKFHITHFTRFSVVIHLFSLHNGPK